MEEKIRTRLSDNLAKAGQKLKWFVHSFNEDETKFRLVTTIKICSIPFLTFLIMFGLILVILRLDLHFFEAHGISKINFFKETFYEYVLKNVLESLPYIGLFFIALVFIGVYIANLFLRPFRLISEYCQKTLDGEKKVSYDPDFFTDLKLLTRFSEYFFNYMENSIKEGRITSAIVPSKFTRIHTPVFEKDFFVQFSFLVVLTSISVGGSLHLAAVEIHEGLISLAHEILQPSSIVKHFLEKQALLLEEILMFVTALHIVLYVFLAIHLYGKISAPAFGIFATMRSFIKGNYSSRIHLIGHYYLRPNCRLINKYLDFLVKNYVKND